MHNLQSSPEMSVFVRGLLRRSPALYVETYFAPSYWTHLEIWLPTILILTLGLLQPTKGVIAAVHWKLGMHGFEQAKRARRSVACA
jgi:uncharacterized protein (DUF983 family)